MSGSTLLALSYGLLAVFFFSFVFRSVRLARLPIHLRWELAPIPRDGKRAGYGGSYLEEYEWWKKPREESLVSEMAYMLKEIFFLKALWEHNRRLWWFSFPFHIGLYVLTAVAGLFFIGGAAAALGWPGPGFGLSVLLRVLSAVGCVLGAVGAAGLLVSRLLSGKLRIVTTPVAVFNLALLLAVFVTGGLAVLSVPDYAGYGLGYARGLFTARPLVGVPGVYGAHLVLVLLFLAYLPFSQMMHFVAKYFTYHQVRWDDRPLEVGGRMEREVLDLLSQPVTWAAPHVGADGRRNWVDVATEEIEE